MDDPAPDRRFSGVARLYGDEAARRLQSARVAVVGIGGVGSWSAEALARCGVGGIALVDLDHVAESNTNRQVHALEDTFGAAKVDVMARRIEAIHPGARVERIEAFVEPDNVETLLRGYDVVLDCIDQVQAKAALIDWCLRSGQPVITSGAAGGRLDPTRIRRADLARADGDPLLAKLRYRLRRHYGFARTRTDGRAAPKLGVEAVYSDEPVRRPAAADCDPRAGAALACHGYGSSVVVTAPLGFAVAAAAIERLLSRARPPAD